MVIFPDGKYEPVSRTFELAEVALKMVGISEAKARKLTESKIPDLKA